MNKLRVLTTAVLLAGAGAAQAQVTDIVADVTGVVPYVIDQRGVVVRNATDLCWRTGYWTPALAEEAKAVGSEFPVGCACDKDLMPKAKCEPKPVVAPPAPPPPPAPQSLTVSEET